MYELICPDCKHVMKTPFARVGAVATCPQCKRRFPVSAETLRRVVNPQPTDALSASVEPAAATPPAPPRGPAADPPKPPPRPPAPAIKPAASGPVGADLLDDDELDSEADDVAALATAANAGMSKGARRQRQHQRDIHRRQQGPIILLSLFFLLLAGGITAAVFYFRNQQVREGRAPLATSNDAPPPTPTDALNLNLTLLTPERVPRSQWEPINEPGFAFSRPNVAIKIENDRTVLDENDRRVLEADVKLSRFGVLEQASIVVTLVDDSGTGYARASCALRNLTANRAARVRLPIPQEYFARLGRVDLKAEFDEHYFFADNAAFDDRDLILNVVPYGERTRLEIKTYNPIQAPLERAMFLVKAFNKSDRELGAWVLRWNDPIGERQPVQFAVMVPLKPAEITRWEVVGEGVPDRKK